jgi:hypothetical protein
MSRGLGLVASAAALAALFAAVPLAANGHAAKRIVITERNTATSATTQVGTFVAAGAVNDAGSVTATFSVVPSSHPGVGLLTGTHVLTGSSGTITVETRAKVIPFPPPTPPRALATGKWRVVSGTGSYAGLRGGGKIAATADFTNGEITIAREGKVKR